MGRKVILDLFSGRPNPSWHLSPPEMEELDQRLAALRQVATEHRPDAPRLGYRGFHIAMNDQDTHAEAVAVYHGTVRRSNGTWFDPDRALERWLLQTASGQLDLRIHDFVLRELNAS